MPKPMPKPALSVLDLTPISAGYGSGETLRASLALAQAVDGMGYSRYWLAEHHNTSMLASAVPELMIGQIAAVTRHLRVGAGGIMLPNHAPLKVAENFRLLEALFPGRIDLGLGRAPGTDQFTALLLRGSREALLADDFPAQLAELQGFLGTGFEDDDPRRRIQAMPFDASAPALWMLGSSTYGAQMAARQGLPFAFAHHINPEPAHQALALYHQQFRPSPQLAEPYAILAVSAICAETDAAAQELASSAELGFARFYQLGGRSGPIPSVAEALAHDYTPQERQIIAATRGRMFVGGPATLHRRLSGLAAETGARELMISTLIHAPEARKASYRLLAEAFEVAARD